MDNLLTFELHYPVFQPLVQLETGHVVGYETLLRSKTNQSPEVIFHAARSMDRLYELDIHSMKKAVTTYFANLERAHNAQLLFMNVFPSTLLTPAFFEFVYEELSNLLMRDRRVVLEINEASEEEKMWEIPLLGQKIRELRQAGFLIALDDVGSGAASLKKMIEYEPDIVKLDRYFGNGLALRSNKQKLVSMFVEYCRGQIQLVLEGLEEPEDLLIAKALGVPIGQGYLLGRPGPLVSSCAIVP